ncbi:WhiB family transcriptional regulator [Zhihengliuella sp.]|uniref:WhiB family transcriptional regulator n=1 Tax=Zhihengliuella sp. TaxID=1954483 RepID=UPI0028118846|nr:WhiB family transcriptional regulator [Zhihengliuella sp.]
MGTPERIHEHNSAAAQASKHYGSRGVPADWFLDPADDAAAERFRESSLKLEDQATAFLAAHEAAGLGSEAPGGDRLGAVQELYADGPHRDGEALQGSGERPAEARPAERNLWLGLIGDAEDEGELGWQTEALCAQTDPEAFFPEKGGSTRDAKKVCGACNVRAECLEYALSNDERFGIWGGLSERERRRLRKRAV